MSAITYNDFHELASHARFPALSIYMSTGSDGGNRQGDRVALKNLLRQGEKLLAELGVPHETAAWMMEPAWTSVDDEDFWLDAEEGVALFMAPQFFRSFRLSSHVAESAMAGDRFHLVPLLSLLQEEERFYLLALTQNHVRLFEGNAARLVKVEMPKTPVSLAEAMRHADNQRQLQLHSAGAAGHGGAVFHGKGGVEEDTKRDLLEFFHLVDHGVRGAIRNVEAPLLLVGLEYMLPIYRRANHYANLEGEGIAVNPDSLDLSELHARAYALVAQRFARRREESLARFRALLGTGLASATASEVLTAAGEGRVACLFLETSRGKGIREANPRRLPESVSDYELNDAVLATNANGGAIFTVPTGALDSGVRMAAIFRY